MNEPSKKQKSPERQKETTMPSYRCCNRCTCECIKKVEQQYLVDPRYPPNYEMERDPPKRVHQQQSPPHYARPQQCNRQMDYGPPTVQNLQQSHPHQPAPQMQQQATSSKPKPKISPKKPSRACMITGGVELVPLLAKRRDERPISLSTTDITKYKINKSR